MLYLKLPRLESTFIVPCWGFQRISLLIICGIDEVSFYHLEETNISYYGALSILPRVLDTLVIRCGEQLELVNPWPTYESVVGSVYIDYIKRCPVFYMAKLFP